MIMVYLFVYVSIPRNFVWRCRTKNTMPEPLDKIQVVLVDLVPGIVASHAKLYPVWKDDRFEFLIHINGKMTRLRRLYDLD